MKPGMMTGSFVATLSVQALWACGTAITTKREGITTEEHRIVYQYGVVDTPQAIERSMTAKANELCPKGWNKISEERLEPSASDKVTVDVLLKLFSMGQATSEQTERLLAKTIVWNIRCNPSQERQ